MMLVPMNDRMRVPANALRSGDVCVPSGTTIIGGPQRGVRTPPGKVELTVRRRSGKVQWVTWGARTEITILRRDA